MYTKPTLSTLSLDVEQNSCNCGGTPVLSKFNPSNAACGAALMTYSTSAQ